MGKLQRFVILTHDHPHLHWDLMLETGEVLRTWRLATPPQQGIEIAATPLPDHRRLYLDYEGPVSGDRGTVVRWDAGTYRVLEESPARIEVVLEGRRISGPVVLSRVADGDGWMFCSP